MLRTHRRVLEAHGLVPVTVSDPHEGLDEVERMLPCVVVVDLVMPGMGGLEFVTRLRTQLGRECPPVVLVSANLVQLAPMEQIMFDALIPKPYGVDGFVSTIKKLARAHADRRQMPSGTVRKGSVVEELTAEDGET